MQNIFEIFIIGILRLYVYIFDTKTFILKILYIVSREKHSPKIFILFSVYRNIFALFKNVYKI